MTPATYGTQRCRSWRGGWKDEPATFAIVKALAQSDDDSRVRQAALQELSRGWKDESETLAIDKALAPSDDHSDVR